MISKKQIQTMGNTLLACARVAALEQRSLGTLPVPLMFRFGELYYFEKWQHPLLLVEALKVAARTPSLKRMWLLSSTLALITSYVLATPLFEANGLIIWISSTVLLLPAYLHRRELMRRHIWEKT
jgi:hypothetical protein